MICQSQIYLIWCEIQATPQIPSFAVRALEKVMIIRVLERSTILKRLQKHCVSIGGLASCP
ncbi:hypothetical protein Q668_00275 [Alcanivorax sp. PN-3]|nr:hypothetical protein Q668_00275 [Alcanivorax sp. PN-3]